MDGNLENFCKKNRHSDIQKETQGQKMHNLPSSGTELLKQHVINLKQSGPCLNSSQTLESLGFHAVQIADGVDVDAIPLLTARILRRVPEVTVPPSQAWASCDS